MKMAKEFLIYDEEIYDEESSEPENSIWVVVNNLSQESEDEACKRLGWEAYDTTDDGTRRWFIFQMNLNGDNGIAIASGNWHYIY